MKARPDYKIIFESFKISRKREKENNDLIITSSNQSADKVQKVYQRWCQDNVTTEAYGRAGFHNKPTSIVFEREREE